MMNISSKEFRWMVEQIVSDMITMLIEHNGFSFSRAFEIVYNSETYKALSNPQTNLYYQSSGYVYSYLLSEINTGTPN